MLLRRIFAIILTISLLAVFSVQPALARHGSSAKSGVEDSHGGAGKGQGGSGGGSSHHDSGSVTPSEPGETDEGDEGGSDHSDGKRGGVGAGGKGSGKGGEKKGGSKRDSAGGTITLTVKVEGLPSELLPVNVTLTREGVDQVVETETTDEGTFAVFESEASGDCFLAAEPRPGYLIPSKPISLIGVEKKIETTLTYTPGSISVTGIALSQSSIKLIKGYTEKLFADIIPANANDQGISWQTSDQNIASIQVISAKEVRITATNEGDATITAISDENNDIATECAVTVVTIESLVNPASVTAKKDQLVVLPATVNANLSDGTYQSVAVSWVTEDGIPVMANEDGLYIFQVDREGVDVTPRNEILLYGSVQGTEHEAIFRIELVPGLAIPVKGVSLTPDTLQLTPNSAPAALTVEFTPVDPTNKELTWTSSNEEVATVSDTGVVTPVGIGNAVITVRSLDGGYKDYCIVTVSPEAEVPLIYVTGGNEEGQFASAADVEINVERLVSTLDFSDNQVYQYYVKVEQNGQLLGQVGTVQIASDTVTVNLYDATQFEATDVYSQMYFLFMSAYSDFPNDDEKTMRDNFKIGSSVPSVPEANVRVNVDIFGGPFEESPEGIIFLLCREMEDKNGDGTISWKDYYTENIPGKLYSYDEETGSFKTKILLDAFSDEVKMMGVTNENGVVEWIKPRETLKLGGYYLLEVTPDHYKDNLDEVDSGSEDGELVKAIRLARDGIIEKTIYNIYDAPPH